MRWLGTQVQVSWNRSGRASRSRGYDLLVGSALEIQKGADPGYQDPWEMSFCVVVMVEEWDVVRWVVSDQQSKECEKDEAA